MIFDSVKKLLGLDPNDRALKHYSGLTDIINSYTQDIHAMTDESPFSRTQGSGSGQGNSRRPRRRYARSVRNRPRSQQQNYRLEAL